MAQIIKGIFYGNPGPVGSTPMGHFYGTDSPLNSTDPLVINAAVGSMFSDFQNGNLYFKGLSGWQQISIP